MEIIGKKPKANQTIKMPQHTMAKQLKNKGKEEKKSNLNDFLP